MATNNTLQLITNQAAAAYFKESEMITNDIVEKLLDAAATMEDRQKLKAMWFVQNPFKDNLTFAERKVNLESIARSFDAFEQRFNDEVKVLTDKEKKRILAEIKAAVQANDTAALMEISADFKGDLAKQYAQISKEIFETGKKTASDEMQVKVPGTDKDVSGMYRAQADHMEGKIADDITNTARDEAFYQIQKWVSTATILKQIEKALDQKIEKLVRATTSAAVGGAFNTGRIAVYEANPDKIYAFQYTAVIDNRTTNICKSMHGRVIAKDDPDFYRFAPPLHTNCRSFWVEILNNEFIKPKISSIPASIPRDRTGYTNFQDLQKVIPAGDVQEAIDARTRAEKLIQANGVFQDLLEQLKQKGVNFK